MVHEGEEGLDIEISAMLVDGDGDRVTETFTVSILNDGPSISTGDQSLDESDGLGSVHGVLNVDFGADGGGGVSLAAEGASWNAGSHTLSADDGSWRAVLDPEGGYTFTQLAAMEHPDGTNANDGIPIVITATVTDSDGGRAESPFIVTIYDDGPSISVSDASLNEADGLGSVSGELTYDVGADGGAAYGLAAAGATWSEASGLLIANDGSWRVSLDVDGGYTFTQLAPMVHDGDERLDIEISAMLVDGDGDRVSETFTVSILDDGPSIRTGDQSLDESDGLGSVHGALSVDFGADGAGGVSLAAEGASWSAGSHTLSADDGSWRAVLDPEGGYTFTQLAAMAHPDGTNANDGIPIVITATVTDADGGRAESPFTVTIYDDGPVAQDDLDTVAGARGATTGGNVILGTDADASEGARLAADAAGADGAARLTRVEFDGQTASFLNAADVRLDAEGGRYLEIDGDHGRLTIREDGDYSYRVTDPLAEGFTEQFLYTIADGDGDERSAALRIDGAEVNEVPEIDPRGTALDEDALMGNGSVQVTQSLNAVFGINGPGEVVFAAAPSTPLTSRGEAIELRLSDDGRVVEGSAGGRSVLRVELNDNGSYTTTLNDVVEHPDTTAEDTVEALRLTVIAHDGDADTSLEDRASGVIEITINDDVPVADVATAMLYDGEFEDQIVNGSFESHTLDRQLDEEAGEIVDRGHYGVVREIEGWRTEDGSPGMELQLGRFGLVRSQEGEARVELQSSGESQPNVTIYQEVESRAGVDYTLTFHYHPRMAQQGDNLMKVTWEGEDVVVVDGHQGARGVTVIDEIIGDAEVSIGRDGWATITLTVTATEDGSRLEFTGLPDEGGRTRAEFGALLDNVTLVGQAAGHGDSLTADGVLHYGADGPHAETPFSWRTDGLPEQLSWSSADGGATLIGANRAGETLLRVEVDPVSGAYSLTQSGVLPDGIGQLDLSYQLMDGDGDVATGQLILGVDRPAVVPEPEPEPEPVEPPDEVVDEGGDSDSDSDSDADSDSDSDADSDSDSDSDSDADSDADSDSDSDADSDADSDSDSDADSDADSDSDSDGDQRGGRDVEHGNEGLGNGEDAPPPGHDTNQNDGEGASPGDPGSRGGVRGGRRMREEPEPNPEVNLYEMEAPDSGGAPEGAEAWLGDYLADTLGTEPPVRRSADRGGEESAQGVAEEAGLALVRDFIQADDEVDLDALFDALSAEQGIEPAEAAEPALLEFPEGAEEGEEEGYPVTGEEIDRAELERQMNMTWTNIT